MTLPQVGTTVNVTFGDQRVDVKVTAGNRQMLEDGDLTNDLQTIRAADGDANSVSRADFAAAGFDATQCQFLTDVASGVQPVVFGSASLPRQDQTSLQAIINSKPSLTSQVGNSPTAARMQTYLNGLTVTGRNGVVAELANETAMMHVRARLLGDLDTRPPGSQLNFNQLIGSLDNNVGSTLRFMRGGDTPANRQLLADKIMTHPDLSLGDKHRLLNSLGFTNVATNNTAIAAAMAPIHQEIATEAGRTYTTLGGTGSMPETLHMASGDGTGTRGIAGVDDQGIGLMHYGAVTSVGRGTVGGIGTATQTFTPQDVRQPVSFHLSASGANGNGNTISIAHGGLTVSFAIGVGANGQTTIAPASGSTLPAGVTFDAQSNTITFPPSATPYTLTQTSTQLQQSSLDEIFTAVGVTNASSTSANISMELNGVFGSDRFGIQFSRLDPSQQQQVDGLAAWLVAHPDQQLTVNATGQGPTWWDGSRPAEMSGYGSTTDGTSKAQLSGLRSTRLEANVNTGTITVNATTDPVYSNLGNASKTSLSTAGLAAFNTFKANHPGLTDNDVLSALRSFATLEMVQQRLQSQGAAQTILNDATTVQLTNGQAMTYAEYRLIAQR